MKPEQLKALRILTKDREKFLDKVAEIAKEADFSFVKFFKAITGQGQEDIKINKEWFVSIGHLFGLGQKGISKNHGYAFILYHHGTTLKCKEATKLYGLYFYDGRAGEKNLQKAARYLGEAIKLADKSAYYYYALTYFDLNAFDIALANFNKVESKDRNFIKAQCKIVDIHIKQKTYKSNPFIFGMLLSINKKESANFKEAQAYLNKLIENLTMMFEENKESGDYQEAMEICKLLVMKKFAPVSELQNYLKNFHQGSKTYLASDSGHAIAALEQQIALIDEQLRLNGKKIITLSKEQSEQLKEKKTTVENQIENYKSYSNNSEKQLDDIFNPSSKERKRKLETEKRFFNPKRLKGIFTKNFSRRLLYNRLADSNEKVSAIKIDEQPARRLIAAEQAMQQAAINLFDYSKEEFNTELGYFDNPENKSSRDYSSPYNQTRTYTNSYSNMEKLTLDGNTIEYKQRISPNYNRLGDCCFTQLGTYGSILGTIDSLTGKDPEREKQLAKWMIRFSHEGKAISFDELAELVFPAQESDELEQSDIIFINEKLTKLHAICYLVLVKEVSQWQLPKEKKWNLPFATAQARALKLLAEGCLRMEDVFGPDAPYGVFTGNNLVKNFFEVVSKIEKIDELYNEYLKHQHFNEYMSFFKSNKGGEIIATRERIRQDLQEIYGGKEDSDGEGYESEGNNITLKLPFLK